VVFSGDDDGNLVALDARTGKDLWRFSMEHDLFASPVTYMEYLSIAAESRLGSLKRFSIMGAYVRETV
jgi:outer membrane protein assembly factor BamB